MYTAIDPDVQRLSKNLWRPSSASVEGQDRTSSLRSAPRLRPETPNETQFFELPQTGRFDGESLGDSKSISSIDPSVESLVASTHRSAAKLDKTLGKFSNSDYKTISANDVSQLRETNPIAHDRMHALTNEQRRGSLVAGKSESVTLLIPSSRPNAGPSDTLNTKASPRWEEVFHAERSPSGATEVTGKRFHNGEWYQFSSRVATPPQNSSDDQPKQSLSASQASTVFAPEKMLNKAIAPNQTKPADTSNQDLQSLIDAVRGITEGPWKSYLQGATLKGSDHDVKGVLSDKTGTMKAFQAKFDSIKGVLNKIQDVATGIQKVADFLGLAGELGKFGDVLSWIGSIKLPEKPADLIHSILMGTGILPGKAEPIQGMICAGSGEGGLVVTKGGAAAAAFGNGLVNQVGVLQNGDGSSPKTPAAQNKTIPAKGAAKPSKTQQEEASKEEQQTQKPATTMPTEKEQAEHEKPEQEKAEAEKTKRDQENQAPSNQETNRLPNENQEANDSEEPERTGNIFSKTEGGVSVSKKDVPSGDLRTSMGIAYEQKDPVADLGIVKVEGNQGMSTEIGNGLGGNKAKLDVEAGYSISNDLGDELYAKGLGSAGSDGLSAGVEVGLKGALDEDNKIGVAARIDTNQPLLGGNVSTTTKVDPIKQEVTTTTTVEASILRGTIAVSHEHKSPLGNSIEEGRAPRD